MFGTRAPSRIGTKLTGTISLALSRPVALASLLWLAATFLRNFSLQANEGVLVDQLMPTGRASHDHTLAGGSVDHLEVVERR